MQFDIHNLSLFELQNQIERKEFELDEFAPIEVTTDLQFILKNQVPVKPLLVMDGQIKVGSGMVRDMLMFLQSDEFLNQTGGERRNVEDFPVKVYVARQINGIDVHKLIRHWFL